METAIDFIKNYALKGSKYGLEREKYLLKALGSPQDRLKILHVAGSNGKGSVCAYLTQILLAAGKTVGTFTSPAVYGYNETYLFNGLPADDATINAYLGKVLSLAQAAEDPPTAFEIETAAAYAMFAGEGCEYAVIECGMGGLNDSTNAVEKKELAVITSVSLEHTAFLGNTILEICRQKGGIVRDCPLVCSARLPDEARDYFARRGAIFAGQSLEITQKSLDGQTFVYGGHTYRIAMHGSAQAYNAAVAAECARVLHLPQDAIERGLERTRLDGRVEIIARGGRTFVLDGGHNPEGILPLAETLGAMRGGKSLVFGCLSDKDVAGVARGLQGLFDEVFIVPPPSVRAMDVGRMAAAFGAVYDNVRVAESIEGAMRAASMPTVCACGTFTILKECRQWIEKEQ